MAAANKKEEFKLLPVTDVITKLRAFLLPITYALNTRHVIFEYVQPCFKSRHFHLLNLLASLYRGSDRVSMLCFINSLFGESAKERQLRMLKAVGEHAEASVFDLEAGAGHDTVSFSSLRY